MFIEDNDDNTTEDTSKETIEELSKEMEDCINQKMRAIADYQNLKRRVDEERKERQRILKKMKENKRSDISQNVFGASTDLD